ncbi:MAG: hypothetical protein RSF73_10765, partial [Ruthenibacterium sp.]
VLCTKYKTLLIYFFDADFAISILLPDKNPQRDAPRYHQFQLCLKWVPCFIFAKRSNSLRTPRRRCTENSSDTPSMFTRVTENPL